VLRVTLGAALGALVFISTALTVELFYVKDVIGASDTAYALVVCGWLACLRVTTLVARASRHERPPLPALVAPCPPGRRMIAQAAWAVQPVGWPDYLAGRRGHGAKKVFVRARSSPSGCPSRPWPRLAAYNGRAQHRSRPRRAGLTAPRRDAAGRAVVPAGP
jgi:hypothetical protein